MNNKRFRLLVLILSLCIASLSGFILWFLLNAEDETVTQKDGEEMEEVVERAKDGGEVKVDEVEETGEVRCETKTYKNEFYPDFSFEYDGCEWEVSEIEQVENSMEIQLIKRSDSFDLQITSLKGSGGNYFCGTDKPELFTNGISRILYEDEYLYTSNEIFQKGSNAYNEIVEELITNVAVTGISEENPDWNYCTSNPTTIKTRASESQTLGHISIVVSEDTSTAPLDEIIKTFTY